MPEMESTKKVVIRERNPLQEKTVVYLAITILSAVLFIGIAFAAGVYEFLILGGIGLLLTVGIFGFDRYLRKNPLEFTFTEEGLYVCGRGEEKRVDWDRLVSVTAGLSPSADQIFEKELLLQFQYAVLQKNGLKMEQVEILCTEEDVRAVQTLLPCVIGTGEYCLADRGKELEALENRYEKYRDHSLFDVSVRARAAYLICCLENALNACKHTNEWKEKRKGDIAVLWLFTSCIGEEQTNGEWVKEIEKEREKREVFSDFLPENGQNFITFATWRQKAESVFSATWNKSPVVERILSAIERVTDFTPERTGYSYASVRCYETLDEVTVVEKLLQEKGIPLPMPKFYPEQTYLMYRDEVRSPFFGIGLPFNGRAMYSSFAKDETPDTADPVRRENEALDRLVAPVMKESNERKARQPKMTNPMTGALWVGVALSLLAFALYVSAFVVQEEMLFFPCFLFGVFGNIITAFSGHGRREYNIALNQEGRFKWFDRLLFLGMGVANVIFTFHTLENLASFLFVGFLLFMFLVSGIACFWQVAEAFLTDHPLEDFGPIAVILSALGIVCAFFYRVYVFVPLVVFSIETSGTAILLFGKAVKHSEPPQRRLREILFAFSLVSFLLCIFLIMQTVQNVDEICMDVYFVVQTAAYVVLFIRSLFFAK